MPWLPLVQVSPLLNRAHAHNDYAHARPLAEALENGFNSVEADVFLVDGELRVGHDRKDLVAGRTLASLYLDPLMARWKGHPGSIETRPRELILLVDIKTDGERVYDELRRVLPKYRPMLTTFDNGTVSTRAVTVILSGDRPIATLRAEKSRMAFIDGRPNDIDGEPDAKLMPLISDSFMERYKTLAAPLSEANHAEMVSLVNRTHAKGMKFRFWATPETPACWTELYVAGVDLLGTDRLADLRAFLLKQPAP